ncbi:Evolved beta-galactosidase subunit alpha, partial [termite gut metagenome]
MSLPKKLSVWKDASYQDIKASEFSVREKKTYTEVKCSYYYRQTGARWYITYQISVDGIIKVNNKFEIKKQKDAPMIPRIGLRMQLSDSLTQLSYYGRGPAENYWDRKTSQFLGEYKLPIARMYEPYVRPQENNHRTDVSWFAITNQAYEGLLFMANDKLEFNASNYLLESLDSGESTHNNAPRTETTHHLHAT